VPCGNCSAIIVLRRNQNRDHVSVSSLRFTRSGDDGHAAHQVLNSKTAKTAWPQIPDRVLALADEVIE
jgi:hypothetical protein